ncbi:hypothetical protein [Bradyrhizobium macuxiense]|nr:hypothetical protein [Bradyrhizobium macuxiense]
MKMKTGRQIAADTKALLVKVEANVAKAKAKRATKKAKPTVAKYTPKSAPKPAKPMSRSARLRRAEAEVKASKPRDKRCVWREMNT